MIDAAHLRRRTHHPPTFTGGPRSRAAADGRGARDGAAAGTTPGTAIRIVLADDHPVTRTGLGLLLGGSEGLEVVAGAGDHDATLRAVEVHRPDVLVLVLNLPGAQTSLEVLPLVRARSPETMIVMLTMEADPEYARRALRAGAIGYVLMDAADGELVDAIRRAATGLSSLDPSLAVLLATLPEVSDARPDNLSEREVEVLHLLALGYTNAEMGGRLFLSVRTVETHRAHVQQKLGRSSRAELVRYALEHDMLS